MPHAALWATGAWGQTGTAFVKNGKFVDFLNWN